MSKKIIVGRKIVGHTIYPGIGIGISIGIGIGIGLLKISGIGIGWHQSPGIGIGIGWNFGIGTSLELLTVFFIITYLDIIYFAIQKRVFQTHYALPTLLNDKEKRLGDCKFIKILETSVNQYHIDDKKIGSCITDRRIILYNYSSVYSLNKHLMCSLYLNRHVNQQPQWLRHSREADLASRCRLVPWRGWASITLFHALKLKDYKLLSIQAPCLVFSSLLSWGKICKYTY